MLMCPPPPPVEILRNVRRKSCSKKDIVGAQNSHCCYVVLLLAARICNCSTPKNAQTSNLADAVLGARESPEQLGYHSENNGPCGRMRFKNDGSCGPKVESVFPRTSLPSKALLFSNCSSPMP